MSRGGVGWGSGGVEKSTAEGAQGGGGGGVSRNPPPGRQFLIFRNISSKYVAVEGAKVKSFRNANILTWKYVAYGTIYRLRLRLQSKFISRP